MESNTYGVTDSDSEWTVVGNRRRKQHSEQQQPIEQLLPLEMDGNSPLPLADTNTNSKLPFDVNDIVDKIYEPCWFYNNGGCRHKDGTEKTATECKYLHNYSDNVKRPPHLSTRKPCDKFNLEGECKWHDNCKYSHRNLTPEEWSRFYPGIPYTLKTNVQKRLEIENRVLDLEGRLRILEFKQDGISKDVQQIGQTLQQLVRGLHVNGQSF